MSRGEVKKLYIIYILEILKKYSDYDHKLKQQDIIDYMKKDYDVICERKTISRNLGDLMDAGYEIERDSEGYYLAENQLLLATETLGVYCGNETFLPSFLVGCQMSLDSIQKAAKLKLQQMLFPHYGLISGQELQDCLVMGQQCIHQVCRLILELLTSGKTTEEILEYLTELFYTDRVKPIYPYDAYRMNTEIMINLVRKELFSVHSQP